MLSLILRFVGPTFLGPTFLGPTFVGTVPSLLPTPLLLPYPLLRCAHSTISNRGRGCNLFIMPYVVLDCEIAR